MTDNDFDFYLAGFRTARVNSAHHLGDYVVEWWDEDWEDRFWAEMEEIKTKEILKFQEQLAKEVFHQVPGVNLMVDQSSEVPGQVVKQRRDDGYGNTALRHDQKKFTDAIMVDIAATEDDTEAPSFSTAAEDESEENSGLPLSFSLAKAVTDQNSPSHPAIPPKEEELDEENKPCLPYPPFAVVGKNGPSFPASPTNDMERNEVGDQQSKPFHPPKSSLVSPRKPKHRSRIAPPPITPSRITKPKKQSKPRGKVTFTWLHPHRTTIAIILKHFNLSWPDLEKVSSHIYPEDVKKGGKVPGPSEWAGNIRFQWVRESRTFKSAKYYDAVQAELEVEEGKESVEYRKILADVVSAMGTLGIASRSGAGERKVLDFSKK